MNFISYVKKAIKQNQMKKVRFKVTLSLEELSSVPYVNGTFFAKIKFLDSMKGALYSSHEKVSDHKVRWNSNHMIFCKIPVDIQTNTLESVFLKITIKQESNDGKSSQTFGSVTMNLSSFANKGDLSSRRWYILASKDKSIRQANSLLQISLNMCQTFGDPCFRIPEEDCSNCVNVNNIALEAGSNSSIAVTKSPIELVISQDDNNEENDEYLNNDTSWNGISSLKIPQMAPRGHRRNISDNISSCMLPRNSNPTLFDEFQFSEGYLKRYHSSVNCAEQPSFSKNLTPAESSGFLNKQILINSTRGSRAQIVENVFRTCFEAPSQK